MIELYKHQKEQIEETAQAFIDGSHSLLFQSATGSGKSIMAAYMVAGAIKKGGRVWFVVPRNDLLKQTSLMFQSFRIKHTFISPNYTHYYDNNLSLCMLETLRRNITEYQKPTLIIIDEAHFSGKAIGEVVGFALNNGIKIIGLSATPARNDNTGMGDWFDIMTLGKSIRWLIDKEYLAEYKLIRPEVYRRTATTNQPVDLFKEYLMGRRSIVFCKDINHSKKVAGDFNANGIRAAHIDGTADIMLRKKVFTDLATGKLDAIINSKLLNFGFDLELITGIKVTINGLLDLAKCGSLPAQMQKNGRALRKQEGLSCIVDSAGNSLPEMHGLPCTDRDWILTKGNVRDRDLEIRLRRLRSILCTACGRPSKFTGSPVCPRCGAEYIIDKYKNIKIINGRMVEITPEMIAAEKEKQEREKKSKKKRIGFQLSKAETIQDLKNIAIENNYKKGWVYKQASLRKIYK